MKEFEVSKDSLLNDGIAYFGKRGKLMHVVKVLELRPRKNSVDDVQFKIFLARQKRLRILHFCLGEVEIVKDRKSITYRFWAEKGPRRTLTVILGIDELALAF